MKQIKSYRQAREYLGNKKERPYAHNTRIEIDGLNMGHEVITVKYHGNPVVNMFPDGTTTFNSCGWRTLTTKERINWFLPDGFCLYQEKSVWYIRQWKNQGNDWRDKAHTWVFADGIAIKNGEVYNDSPMSEQIAIKAKVKRIRKYVDGYVTALLNGKIDQPSGGDCWYCYMQTEAGNSLGDATDNTNHIETHFKESYYVPSLLMNAYKFNSRLSLMAKDGIARLMNGESISDWQKDITARDVKACLTAYLKHALGIAQ